MPRTDRIDVRTIALMPLLTLLTVGVVSVLAGAVLFTSLTAPRGDGGCVVFDATMVAAVVTIVSGLFTGMIALAHLRRVDDRNSEPEIE
jgi:hypothetical protein